MLTTIYHSGYACVNEAGIVSGDIIQTCRSIAAAQSSIVIGTCESGYMVSTLTTLQLPLAVPTSDTSFTITSYEFYAAMMDIRWQASDLHTTTTTPLIPGVSTSSSTANATSPPSTAASSSTLPHGLSTGAEAAIGVVVPCVAIAAIAGLVLWWRRRRRQQQRRGPEDENDYQRPNGSNTGAELGGTPLHELADSVKPVEMDNVKGHSGFSELQGSDVPMLG